MTWRTFPLGFAAAAAGTSDERTRSARALSAAAARRDGFSLASALVLAMMSTFPYGCCVSL